MKRGAIASVAAGALALGAWGGYRVVLNRKKEAETSASKPKRTPSVRTAIAGPATFSRDLEAVASLQSPERALLSARVAAPILAVNKREGDRVRTGEVLVRLDPADAKAAVAAAEAALAEARYRLEQARLGTAAAEATASGGVGTARAALDAAIAERNRVRGDADSLIATARAALADATARVGNVRANLLTLRANQKEVEANLVLARTTAERQKTLADQGAIARQLADDARTARDVQVQRVASAAAAVEGGKRAVDSAVSVENTARANLKIAERKNIADLAAAEAALRQARVQADLAAANRTGGDAYAKSLDALRATVAAAEATRNGARSRLADTEIRAPFDGVVTARTLDPGSLAQPGTAILTVESTDSLFARATLPVERAAALSPGTPAVFVAPGLGETPGTVSSAVPSADPLTRQSVVLVALPSGGKLVPGAFGRIRLKLPAVAAPVAVPREAVKGEGDETTVNVVDKDGTISVRPVTLGEGDPERVAIEDGVKAGEKVVILAYARLKDGGKVRQPGDKKGGSR